MSIKSKILRALTLLLVMSTAFLTIGFAVKRDVVGYHMEDISVEIKNRSENFFVDKEDVMALIMADERDSILGDKYGRVNLKEIEDRIESHSFVKDAQVFRDLKGHLVVRAHQSRPVARLISNRGDHAYISEEGLLLPVSTKYTSRVVVITGEYVSKLIQLESVQDQAYAKQLFEMINYINDNQFWQMQIGEINVARNGDITMYPQVGGQKLEFGKPERIDKKFKKLKIFFKEIMPTKGWNAYSRVNVAFRDQIICE